MKNYHITEEAINDPNEIWIYSNRKWSKNQADKYYQQLIKKIKFISENIDTCKEINLKGNVYRVSSIQSHRIFFKKVDSMTISIIRILHQKMDIRKKL